MGGRGSGRRPDFGLRLEDLRSIDIRVLARRKLLRPMTGFCWDWWRGDERTGSMAVWVGHDEVTLTCCRRSTDGTWQDRREHVAIEHTPTNWRGRRPWFACPGCGRRCAILYDADRFICRECAGLSYASQSGQPMERALRRAQKIRERLGGSANMTKPFPGRPKGMHHRTYKRLRDEGMAADDGLRCGLSHWIRRHR